MPHQDIGYLLKNITDKLKGKADADLKRYNLTFTQSQVLAFLHDNSGQATQKEIEMFLKVSHPTVVGVVSRMEQNGYVTCWFDAQDRRNKIVQLTRQAEEIGNEMNQNINQNEKLLLASLSDDEVQQLQRMLAILYNNLE